MAKARFGEMVRGARMEAGLSLRTLATRTGIDFSRLSRIETGTRPAPGLPGVRRLAEILGLDMGDLLVAAGTSREVVEHLLWEERLRAREKVPSLRAYRPERSSLREKNAFRVSVHERDGAICSVCLGDERITVLSFAPDEELRIEIPPEAVLVSRPRGAAVETSAENALPMKIKKVRRLGQVTNLVLSGRGFELDTLHAGPRVEALGLVEGDDVVASFQATAVRTGPAKSEM
jgi:transcriptional regulator with XRE-family HTH domain